MISNRLSPRFPSCFYLKSLNGIILWCNDGLAELLNRNSTAEIIGKSDYDLFPDIRNSDTFRENEKQIITTKKEITIEETISLSDDRNPIYLTHKVPLKDQNGNVIAIAGASIDISLQKEHEKLIESTPVGFFSLDVHGNFFYASNRCVEITGLQSKELLNRSLAEIIYPLDRQDFSDLWSQISNEKIIDCKFKCRIQLANKKIIKWVLIQMTVERLNDGTKKYIGSIADINDLCGKENYLHKQQQKLANISQYEFLTTLTCMAAQQINRPLAIVSSYSQELAKRLTSNTYRPSDFIDVAKEIGFYANRIGEVVYNLFNAFGERKINSKGENINEVIKETFLLLQPVIPEDINVVFNLDDALPAIRFDKLYVEQVIANILQISTSASRVSNKAERIIIINTVRSNYMVEVTITDNFSMFSQHTLKCIFNPFTPIKDKIVLKLVTCRSIIEAQNGQFLISTSNKKKGTQFKIILPCT